MEKKKLSRIPAWISPFLWRWPHIIKMPTFHERIAPLCVLFFFYFLLAVNWIVPTIKQNLKSAISFSFFFFYGQLLVQVSRVNGAYGTALKRSWQVDNKKGQQNTYLFWAIRLGVNGSHVSGVWWSFRVLCLFCFFLLADGLLVTRKHTYLTHTHEKALDKWDFMGLKKKRGVYKWMYCGCRARSRRRRHNPFRIDLGKRMTQSRTQIPDKIHNSIIFELQRIKKMVGFDWANERYTHVHKIKKWGKQTVISCLVNRFHSLVTNKKNKQKLVDCTNICIRNGSVISIRMWANATLNYWLGSLFFRCCCCCCCKMKWFLFLIFSPSLVSVRLRQIWSLGEEHSVVVITDRWNW